MIYIYVKFEIVSNFQHWNYVVEYLSFREVRLYIMVFMTSSLHWADIVKALICAQVPHKHI